MVPTPSSHEFFLETPFEDEATRVAPSGCRLAATVKHDADATRLYESNHLRKLARSIFKHSDSAHVATKDARTTIPDVEEDTAVRPFELAKKPSLLMVPPPLPPTPATMQSRADQHIGAALEAARDAALAAVAEPPAPVRAPGSRRVFVAIIVAIAIGSAGSFAVHHAPDGAFATAVGRALSVVFPGN